MSNLLSTVLSPTFPCIFLEILLSIRRESSTASIGVASKLHFFFFVFLDGIGGLKFVYCKGRISKEYAIFSHYKLATMLVIFWDYL